MNSNGIGTSKRLVLAGGGHSHVDVLKQFGMSPPENVEVILLGNELHAPYSGMLPGYIAGHYSYYDCHIDLRPLARRAQCAFYQTEVTGVDSDKGLVYCSDRPPVAFDYLSINIGSIPEAHTVPGAHEYALPAKPVRAFIRRWHEIKQRAVDSENGFRIVTVGGGAGGVELTLTMQHALRAAYAERGKATDDLEFHIVTDGDGVMLTHNNGVRRRMVDVLDERGVHTHLNAKVNHVYPGHVTCGDDETLPYDALMWVTHAAPPGWVAESGLELDADGFIVVDETLRSISHPNIFAAGDIASMKYSPRPKSGVFAVRQGPYLGTNLRNTFSGEPLETFSPQKRFLNLISTGDKNAIASRGRWAAKGRFLWRLKDRIDRRWMAKYTQMSGMEGSGPGAEMKDAAMDEPMYCGGCGCKVGATILDRVLKRLGTQTGEGVLVGLDHPDDAAVVAVPEGKLAVHTVDFFKSFLDDPYVFGRVTTVHCLSDVYAMGAVPHTVLAMVTLPHGDEERLERTLYDLLSGARKVLDAEGVHLVGGHTTEGDELSFGLAVNGHVDPNRYSRKSGLNVGDSLILTKPLGTGVIFAADMRGAARGFWIEGAVKTMLVSNCESARILFRHEASACTDITGFGLAGHLSEMVSASGLRATVDLSSLALLDGAAEASASGIASSLYPQNEQVARAISRTGDAESHEAYPLIFDPQTAGGLLAGVATERAEACVKELREHGYPRATIIGRVEEASADSGFEITVSAE